MNYQDEPLIRFFFAAEKAGARSHAVSIRFDPESDRPHLSFLSAQ